MLLLRSSINQKTDENVEPVNELVHKTGKSISVKLLTCREFNLGHFRAFWKTTLKCVWLLPDSHPSLWVRGRKGNHVDTWRTFKRGLKETQCSFQRHRRK
jgi:hypothetical protein